MKSQLEDLSGRKFGFLTALVYAGKKSWLCICDCGTNKIIKKYSLVKGITISCGCYNKKKRITHNKTNSPEYNTWRAMKKRCLNTNDSSYKYYGNKGIYICDSWLEFEKFLDDMGERPPRTSLDRINPFDGYYLENCRWATAKEQANNTRAKYQKP